MSETVKRTKVIREITDSNSPEDELTKIPILPRSAWSSQLSYLKVILKAKQNLDQMTIHQENIK